MEAEGGHHWRSETYRHTVIEVSEDADGNWELFSSFDGVWKGDFSEEILEGFDELCLGNAKAKLFVDAEGICTPCGYLMGSG